MTQPILQLDDVTKAYDLGGRRSRDVLRGITLALRPGETAALVGRSGSGKSTLLHLAAGIDTATNGRVSLDGRDLARLSESERTRLRRGRVGLVFQFFHLLPHLSILENVLLPAWIAGGAGRVELRRAEDLLRRVDLWERRDDRAGQLSGGEMQRVALARALLHRPALVLADEPTGSLDDLNGRVVMDLLLEMTRESGGTLLYVTHSDELAALAQRVWRLQSGVLAGDGDGG
ncbi:MAG: ABC transporter ATP-binding protein [Candidatus Krumholzibacteriia bacterium]